MRATYNVNVLSVEPLSPPKVVLGELPSSQAANRTVLISRDIIQRILLGEDKRLLVVVGPCSIHDEDMAIEYATRLTAVADKVKDRIFTVMRVYFEKPRTTIGWKGLINDPHLDGSFDIEEGLRKARRILLKINEMGLAAGTEMLDPITPQYTADLLSWASIGARTTESPTHRQMASGLSMPVGWKNATDGNVQIAIDAMEASRYPHSFLGIDEEGHTCVFKTRGNPWGHLILRGGESGPNYHPEDIEAAAERLSARGLSPGIMIDCSHGNSRKDHRKQERVWKDVILQRVDGNEAVMGLMLESNLEEGNQPMNEDPASLKYGVSITDPCLGWEKTEELLISAHKALSTA